MSAVQINIGTSNHLDPTFAWYEVFASETNLALGAVEASAEWSTIDLSTRIIHANVSAGETWYFWVRPVYDQGARAGTLVALGSILISGAVSASFLSLTDTPDSYTGHGEKAVAVKADETGLEFIDFPLSSGGSDGGAQTVVSPQGRLTLTSGSPVMTATVTAATTIYYSPYVGRATPIYDGSDFVMYDASELSQATTDSTKSPAAVANNSNYDLFRWVDAGTQRCTRGPAWTSDTARGTGAGTTELERINGIWVNKVAITNGPAAQRGTYVGTVRSNGSAQIDMIFGGAGAAGGEANVLGVWNAYNRVLTVANNFDNTDSWTYTTDTYRAKNNNTANAISFVVGLREDAYRASAHQVSANSSASIRRHTAVTLDSTTAPVTAKTAIAYVVVPTTGGVGVGISTLEDLAPLGFHYVIPLERSQAVGACTWYGDNGGSDTIASTFTFSFLM